VKYNDAGVSLERSDESLRRIRRHVESTFNDLVVGEFGHFGGAIALPGGGPDTPLLVASMDGVGTKVLVARQAGRYADVAGDIVRHGANDCVVLGARPFFFLDYVAWGRLDPAAMEEVVRGLAEACRAEGCVLLGGETAEMPDLYPAGEFDLAGCMVGWVDRQARLDGSSIRPGDAILALPSTGLHTNGYSLARRLLFESAGLGLDSSLPGVPGTVAEALLAPHRSYTKPALALVEAGLARGFAHVTGGGISGNLSRILPANCRARLRRESWEWPPLFRRLQAIGEIPWEEMERTFNLGVGFAVVVDPVAQAPALDVLRGLGEEPWTLGEVIAGTSGVEWV
jgi:phosphoribosylformylglycinamidine cyclo-ligase